MNNKRLYVSTILGGILGVFCIIGAQARVSGGLLLLALWYNRLLMGLIVGLAAEWKIIPGKLNPYLRGLVIGGGVSLAFFLTSGFADWLSFLVGFGYGVILEFVASFFHKKKEPTPKPKAK
ncbi:MAG TPA: hypothetical protein P5560_06200 [Thermotogota bacterium]|nr:hypothetical protein [Thermotogota bacterium]HRW92531.1 hypothetical protein [Thermotogota bacterium]